MLTIGTALRRAGDRLGGLGCGDHGMSMGGTARGCGIRGVFGGERRLAIALSGRRGTGKAGAALPSSHCVFVCKRERELSSSFF